jgi:hypothetical protein
VLTFSTELILWEDYIFRIKTLYWWHHLIFVFISLITALPFTFGVLRMIAIYAYELLEEFPDYSICNKIFHSTFFVISALTVFSSIIY